MLLAVIVLLGLGMVQALKTSPMSTIYSRNKWLVQQQLQPNRKELMRLHEVPLELAGKLDASKSWNVKFLYEGQEKTVLVREDTCLLESGERIFDSLPSSCRNGVCTTCAGKIVAGKENVQLAVHGLGKPQIEAGYICTCQAYPTGEGIVVQMGAYDEVYESQYGQFERSYGELKYTKAEEKKEEKKKGLFGW